jgi:hypothetical protein
MLDLDAAPQVKCKSAPSKRPNKGSCAVRMCVTLVFSGGISITPPADLTNPNVAAKKRIAEGGYTCDVLSFNDTLNVLNVGWPSASCLSLSLRLVGPKTVACVGSNPSAPWCWQLAQRFRLKFGCYALCIVPGTMDSIAWHA